MIHQVFLLLLIVLNLADVATTFYGLSIGGSELNPLFKPEGLSIKLALPIIYAFLFLVCHRFCLKLGFMKGLRILDVKLAVLIIIYMIVVANNLFGIMRVKL